MNLDKQSISHSFSKAAAKYDESAFLQKEVASRLLERLELMKIKPERILDAGCGTGYSTKLLAKKYPKGQLVGVDIAPGMIAKAGKNKSLFDKTKYQIADIEQLPFANNSFDLVFSNLALLWINDQKNLFIELNRVLKPGGLLIFSTFGTDTLMELKQSWSKVDQAVHVNDFYDMHIIGDQVYNAQFENTVMDRDIITLTYKTLTGLMQDIKAVGAHNMNSERSRGMLGKSKLIQLQDAYETFRWQDGQLPATCEIVYGHAWKKKEAPKGDYHTYQVKI